MKKKILTLALLFAMTLTGVLPATTGKADMEPSADLRGTIEKAVCDGVEFFYRACTEKEGFVEIVQITNAKKNLIIPATLNGKKVYRISLCEEYGKAPRLTFAPQEATVTKKQAEKVWEPDREDYQIESIVVKEGIKEIGTCSFYTVSSQTISIAKSVKKIGEYAFSDNCLVRSIAIKNPEIEIEDAAFECCKKLSKITLSKKKFVGKVGAHVFGCSNLKTLKLPYMTKQDQMGGGAFSGIKSLKKVTFDKRNKNVFVGYGWFAHCPKVEIVVGKHVDTFESRVNTESGTVRLLGKKTKLAGFPSLYKTKKGKLKELSPTDVNKKEFYYIQYKKFIVPKGSKAIKMLKRAYYGKVTSKEEAADVLYPRYYKNSPKKVKIVIKK